MNRTGARNYDIWDGSEIEPKINKKKMQFIEFTKDK